MTVEPLREQLGLLRDDADLGEIARSSSAANLTLLLELTEGSVALAEITPPPQATTFARALARRNIPVVELSRAYRISQRSIWRWGVEELRARIDDEAALAEAVEGLSDAVLVTGDALMTAMMERYAVERERWVRSADALHRATVEELLAGGKVDLSKASSRLRYELRRPHVAFVVWAEPGTALLESAAAAIGGPGALVVPMSAGVVAGWCSPDAIDPDQVESPAVVALGSRGDGLEGFRRSHVEALEARRVARLGDLAGPVSYDEIALAALLTKDLDQARVFARRELGELTGDDATANRLATTVLTVLTEQGSPRRAAQKLGVHENTVAKRLRSAERALGRGIDERPAELLAALIIRRSLAG
jgi:phage FluMu protein gp41